MIRAEFWEGAGKDVRCLLCPHACVIAGGKDGACRARGNRGGTLRPLTYGIVSAAHLDPVEKKPLYHFHPGRMILSVGSFGCNLRCGFCQNWEISQAAPPPDIPGEPAEPSELLSTAQSRGSVGVAFTYNEPLVGYEWVKETARLFKAEGLATVLVTNGYANPAPWRELLEHVDAANIDVKSFRDDFYRERCGGTLPPVLENVRTMAALGKHVEVTTLLVPGENDSEREIEDLTDWLAGINDRIPLHFSRYFPRYRYDRPPTGRASLERAARIAARKLKYVYLGNIDGGEFDPRDIESPGSSRGRNAPAFVAGGRGIEEASGFSRRCVTATRCSRCGNALIERSGYDISVTGLDGKSCRKCGTQADIIFD